MTVLADDKSMPGVAGQARCMPCGDGKGVWSVCYALQARAAWAKAHAATFATST